MPDTKDFQLNDGAKHGLLQRKDRMQLNRILVLEDDVDIVAMIELVADEYDLPIDFALTSGDALGLLAKRPYDAMILDWNLPDFNASYFVKLAESFYENHCRKNNYEIYERIPVVVFSAETADKSQLQESKYFLQSNHWKKPMSIVALKDHLSQLAASIPRVR